MQRYMLDTDTASYAMRNRSETLWLKLKHTPNEAMCVSAITAAELLLGIKPYPARHPLHSLTRHFLAGISTVPWDLGAAEAYADVRYSLSLSGQIVGQSDVMIAAHALSMDAVLITNNTRHFKHVSPPLRLENWTQV